MEDVSAYVGTRGQQVVRSHVRAGESRRFTDIYAHEIRPPSPHFLSSSPLTCESKKKNTHTHTHTDTRIETRHLTISGKCPYFCTLISKFAGMVTTRLDEQGISHCT